MRKTHEATDETFLFRTIVCRSCGLMQIAEPIDPEELYRDFNYCFSGWKAQPHIAPELAMLGGATEGRSVLEIGCNDGLFLLEARKSGFGPLLGIEPNPIAAGHARTGGIEVVNEMLSVDLARSLVEKRGRFSIVVLRQVLEHLADLPGFFACLDILLEEEGILFVDVPDVERGVVVGDVTMLWEEHVNSFTEAVLEATLARFGYAVSARERYNFSGGTIAVCARKSPNAAPSVDLVGHIQRAASFSERVGRYQERLRGVFEQARRKGVRNVVYGAGNRACTLVNSAGLANLVDYVVDDQPEKQGLFMPGSGLSVKPSQLLAQEASPILCLLAVNNEHEEKVAARLRASTAVPPIVFTALSPSDIWAELDRVEAELDRLSEAA